MGSWQVSGCEKFVVDAILCAAATLMTRSWMYRVTGGITLLERCNFLGNLLKFIFGSFVWDLKRVAARWRRPTGATLEKRHANAILGVRVGGIIFVAFDCSLFGIFVRTIEIYLKRKRRGRTTQLNAMHKRCCRVAARWMRRAHRTHLPWALCGYSHTVNYAKMH